ncbi:MAG: AsmA family protein [Planctomycetota bacterium]|jgi:hypothetical protein
MRIPLPGGWAARGSILISATLTLSAFVPLPLPIGLINKAIALRAPELELAAEGAWMRWGFGEVILADLRLSHHDVERARVDRVEASLDLRPWSSAFGKPIHLVLKEADGDLDLEVVDSLSKLKSAESTPFSMQLKVHDSSLRWTDADDNLYQLASTQVSGFLAPEGARFEIHTSTMLPAQGSLDVILDAGEDLLDWEIAVQSDAAWVEDWPLLTLADLPWNGARTTVSAFASGYGTAIDKAYAHGALELDALHYPDYDIHLSDFRLAFSGDYAHGLTLDLQGKEAHGAFAGTGALHLKDGAEPEFEIQTHSVEVVVDAGLVDWLDSILPDVGEIVKGLEPRGTPQAGFAATWSERHGFDWSLHVDASDTAVTFRGFEADDGTRISVPYPGTVRQGHLLVGDSVLLYNGMAEMEGQGVAWSTGTFDFREEEDRFAIDLAAEDIALDRRIAHALSGNPEIASLWRDLGSPESGTANLELLLRYEDEFLGLLLRGEARDVDAIPTLLPLPIHADSAWFDWRPGVARFGGLLRAAGGDLSMSGEAREATDEDASTVVRLTMHGNHLAPNLKEMQTLSAYLQLPEEIASFPIAGDVDYGLQMILPVGEEDPHLSIRFLCNDGALSWPDMGLDFTPLHGQGGVAVHGKEHLVSLPWSRSEVADGRLTASLIASSLPELSSATFFGRDLTVDSELLMRLQDFTEQEAWGQHIDWGGKVHVRGRVDPTDPEDFQARVDLLPLQMEIETPIARETFELQGAVHFFPDGFSADVLRFSGPDVDLAMRRVQGVFDDSTLLLDAILDSRRGISLTSRLPLLADAETLAAIEAIGLQGTVRADALQVSAILPDQGMPRFRAEGGLILSDLEIGGPSPLTEGHAAVQVKKAWWSDNQSFGAELKLEQGTGMLGKVGLKEASTHVHIDPNEIRATGVEVSLLGGKLTTDGFDLEGNPVKGHLMLGLDAEAPVAVRCFAHDLELAKMRREVGLRGSLAGKVNGYVNLRSPSPSPTFANGEGRLHIDDGVLGTVPVLSAIWRFAGIRPPVFDEGDLEFRLNGMGRVYVDKMRLDHRLLEVSGEGTIDLDTNLNLKVTLRTFSLLGRLPLLKDLIDLLVEQQVYGPAEAPIIRQRAVGKIGGDFTRPPFPLWVPSPPLPDWRVSPILPVE